jgi:hypothetical protein
MASLASLREERLSALRSDFRVPHSAFKIVPRSEFRVPHSAFPLPILRPLANARSRTPSTQRTALCFSAFLGVLSVKARQQIGLCVLCERMLLIVRITGSASLRSSVPKERTRNHRNRPMSSAFDPLGGVVSRTGYYTPPVLSVSFVVKLPCTSALVVMLHVSLYLPRQPRRAVKL